ncbi:MAG: dihydroorotate dehydrogenase electron transfer subunit [Bacteroidales bacterium]|nr:dihydroorotate dehydrogenase electron transfer subunit [Bacteroidales bacterium]
MTKYINNFKIAQNIKLNSEYFILELLCPEKLSEILPGQFVEVLVENSSNTFLRRPISIFDVNYENNSLKLLIKIIGDGTKKLSELSINSKLNLIYPLGNSYSLPNCKDVLLIGGGCGIAPLFYTAKFFKNYNVNFTLLLGFREKSQVILQKEFSELGKIFYTTDDGGFGERGNVLQHSILKNNNFEKIYSCGPEIMMKNIAIWAKNKNIDCEVSLENLMACGLGACLCCVQKTKSGNKCVCTEGPVFNVNDLLW